MRRRAAVPRRGDRGHTRNHPSRPLEVLSAHYEKLGHFKELMHLLKAGLSRERSHVGMYTELGVVYVKHKPEKLMGSPR